MLSDHVRRGLNFFLRFMEPFDQKKLQDALRDLVTKLNAWGGAIMLYDPVNRRLQCAVGYDVPKDWEKIVNPLDGDSLNVQAFRENRIVRRNDLQIDSLPGAASKHAITAVLIAPIKKGPQVLGTVEILHDKEGEAFSAEDEVFLKSWVTVVASLIP